VNNELGSNDAGHSGREKEWNEGAEVIKSGELSPETSDVNQPVGTKGG
jgi:hypothetical protein